MMADKIAIPLQILFGYMDNYYLLMITSGKATLLFRI